MPRSIPLLVVFLCTAVTPLVAIRHAPLFAVAALVMAGPHLANLWQRWQHGRTDAPPGIWTAGAAFVGGLALLGLAAPHVRCIKIDPKDGTPFPMRAVALLKDSQVQGRLMVFFDWGEYVVWHVGPHVQISIDPRRALRLSPIRFTYDRNFQFQNGLGDWDCDPR